MTPEPPAPGVRPTPLFVLGTPRSGTTFLQQVIDAHPEVFVTDELRAVSWLVQEAGQAPGGLHRPRQPLPHRPTGRAFAEYLLDNAARILVPFYLRQARRAGKPAIRYWGDKYPHYDEILHLLPRLFPEARYVLIHRDLRDTISSVMTSFEWPVERAAPFVCLIYDRYVRKADDLIRAGVVPAERFLHVNYLDLNTDAAAEAGRLFAALGLGYPGGHRGPGAGTDAASRRTASAARADPAAVRDRGLAPALGARPVACRPASVLRGDRRDRRSRGHRQPPAAGGALRLPGAVGASSSGRGHPEGEERGTGEARRRPGCARRPTPPRESVRVRAPPSRSEAARLDLRRSRRRNPADPDGRAPRGTPAPGGRRGRASLWISTAAMVPARRTREGRDLPGALTPPGRGGRRGAPGPGRAPGTSPAARCPAAARRPPPARSPRSCPPASARSGRGR